MRKFKLFLVVFIFIKMAAYAVPAYRSARIFNQSDGNKVVYYLMGDEHCHAYYSADGYMLTLDNTGRNMCYAVQDVNEKILSSNRLAHDVSLRAPEEKLFVSTLKKIDFNTVYQKAVAKQVPIKKVLETDFPKTGNVRGLVLLVEFSDNSFSESDPKDFFYRQLNDSNYTVNGATGSAKYYFKDQSMNRFNPDFDVYGPIKLKKNLAYYGSNNSAGTDMNTADMVVEACRYAHDSLGVDFSKYDYDNDGNVDYVYIRYAGYGESYGAPSYTIWPHSSNINDWWRNLSLDGKAIGKYACSCELRGTNGVDVDNIGTFCHEFGHILGLPDFYNTSRSGGSQVGVWSIMDYGCYNNESKTPPAYSAFERYSMGWLNYTDIDTPADDIELPELTENNFAYRLTTGKDNEYFLLENRQQKGWDAALPATGMMITHVDYNSTSWTNNTVNNNPSHLRYKLEPADNDSTAQTYKGDLYPGTSNNISFTDETKPSSLQWDGTPTKKGVSGIQDRDGIVSFSFMMEKLKTPLALEASDVTESSFTANWKSVDHAKEYILKVVKNLPDSLKPLPISEDFAKMTKGNYPTAYSKNIADSLDSFMVNKGWTADYIYQAGGKCRIGDYRVSGKLTTPTIDMSRDSTFTVGFNARAFSGKSLNFYVSYLDASNSNNVMQKLTFKGNSTEKGVVAVFKGGLKQTKVSVSTQNERLFISDFRILRGTVDSSKVWSVTNPQYIIRGLKDTNYKVTGLDPGFTYTYVVQALSNDSSYNSDKSNEISVTVSVNTGLAQNCSTDHISVEGKVLHVSTSSVQPLIIYGLYGSVVYKGNVDKETYVPLNNSGFYIVKVGNTCSKIFIR